MSIFDSYWVLFAVVVCVLIVAITMSLRRQIRTESGEKRITELEGRFETLENRVTPVSAAFRQELIAELTHNHTPEMDDLLVRIDSLSEWENKRLETLLRERVIEFDDPEITDSERDAATMFLMVNKRVKARAMKVNES